MYNMYKTFINIFITVIFLRFLVKWVKDDKWIFLKDIDKR